MHTAIAPVAASSRPEETAQRMPTEQVTFRLPTWLVRRIDAYVERLSRGAGGAPISRTWAVTQLLRKGLDAAGVPRDPEEPKDS